MRRLHLLTVSCVAFALLLMPLFSVQAQPACGGAGQACCLPQNSCNAGLTCQGGICRAGGAVVELSNPLGGPNQTLDDIVTKILDALLTFGAPLAGVMVVVGGFQMLFSGGSEERFANGKRTILYTVVGYGIIVLANGVAAFIRNLLQ